MNSHQPLTLPHRPEKPRQYGLTSITDNDLTLNQQTDLLENYADLIDAAKISAGMAYINTQLHEKIALYKQHKIAVCFAGSLFEKFLQQNKLDAYWKYLQQYDIRWLNISSAILDISHDIMLTAAREFEQDFTVVAKVGKKFSYTSHDAWLHDIETFLEAGVKYVVLEGMNTGKAGIYDDRGILDHALIDRIKTDFDTHRLIFEAPTEHAQIQLIQMLGSNVNIANVDSHNLVWLEALRLGLRAETFDTIG